MGSFYHLYLFFYIRKTASAFPTLSKQFWHWLGFIQQGNFQRQFQALAVEHLYLLSCHLCLLQLVQFFKLLLPFLGSRYVVIEVVGDGDDEQTKDDEGSIEFKVSIS